MLLAALIILFIGCVKKLDQYGFVDNTTLRGRIIEESEQSPVQGVIVSVTNGSNTYSSTTTNTQGSFELEVDYTKIDKDYYLLLDGGTEGKTRQDELKGMGQELYDYKTIILYNKNNTDGLVAHTKEVESITATSAICKAEVIAGVDVNVKAKGVCWSIDENPTIIDSHTDNGSGCGSFSSNITGLIEKTQYYVRAYARTEDKTVYGEQKTFITTALFASIQYNGKTYYVYNDVEAMTWSSAMAYCENLTTGGFDDWFLPDKDELNALYINRHSIGNFSNDKYWSSTEHNSTNSYCQNFSNGAQNNESKSSNLKVRPVRTGQNSFSAPTVNTAEITDITNNGAKCGGNVTTNGGSAVTDKGICYSKTANPTTSGLHISGGSGIGSFTCTLTSLDQSTTYYIRAYATNSIGTAYGEQKTFVTNGPPTVTTVGVTNVSAYHATCSGNIYLDGGASVTERGVCFSLAPNPTINNSIVTSGAGTGSFTCTITDLTNNTKYYVRAYAMNSYGVAYGEEVSFTTEVFPTFQYGGHTYQVAPGLDTRVSWSSANSYCNNLTLYGFSGWRLPTKDELLQMYAEKDNIGGFHTEYYTTNANMSWYWSSTADHYGINHMKYYSVCFHTGAVYSFEDGGGAYDNCNVRPIRRMD